MTTNKRKDPPTDEIKVETKRCKLDKIQKEWMESLDKIKAYIARTGSCVLKKDKRNADLSNWVTAQQCEYRKMIYGQGNSSMTMEKVQLLRDVGFEFEYESPDEQQPTAHPNTTSHICVSRTHEKEGESSDKKNRYDRDDGGSGQSGKGSDYDDDNDDNVGKGKGGDKKRGYSGRKGSYIGKKEHYGGKGGNGDSDGKKGDSSGKKRGYCVDYTCKSGKGDSDGSKGDTSNNKGGCYEGINDGKGGKGASDDKRGHYGGGSSYSRGHVYGPYGYPPSHYSTNGPSYYPLNGNHYSPYGYVPNGQFSCPSSGNPYYPPDHRRVAMEDGARYACATKEDETWHVYFEKLQQYKTKHGNCNVTPRTDKELHAWVTTQRKEYKRFRQNKASLMTAHRLKRLTDLGFAFPRLRVKTWEDWVEELRRYKEIHGHVNVEKAGDALRTWVRRQRREYRLRFEGKKSPMTPKRIEILIELGFDFDIKRGQG